MTKYIYEFGPDKTDGDASQKNLLGGKGANLAEMAKLKLPVPSGFTISNQGFVYDTYRQLIIMYSDMVMKKSWNGK